MNVFNSFGINDPSSVYQTQQLTGNRRMNAARHQAYSRVKADTVNISNAAFEKYQAMQAAKEMKASSTTGQTYDLGNTTHTNLSYVLKPDYSTWPAENQELRQKLLKEYDKLAQSCSDAQCPESAAKLNALAGKLMLLDVIGGEEVVTEKNLDKALDAMLNGEGGAEKDSKGTLAFLEGVYVAEQLMPTNESLANMYFLNYFPEKLEDDELLKEDEEAAGEDEDSTGAPVADLSNATHSNQPLVVSQNTAATAEERPTKKVAFYKLADYIVESKELTITERSDIPSATKVWIDVPIDVLEAM